MIFRGAPTCPYCTGAAALVTGADIYPHRPDLGGKKFWACMPCDAYVGCHPPAKVKGGGFDDGTVPLGRLANAELRGLKQRAHAAFDPLWKSNAMTRNTAYAWLASALGTKPSETHIGMFDEAQCRAVVAAVAARSPEPVSFPHHQPLEHSMIEAAIKPVPVITYVPCVSSQIASYGYDAGTQTLGVKFINTTSAYHYFDVEPEVYAAMQAADSVGKFFGAKIRNKFAFEKQPDEATGIVFGLLQQQESKYTSSSKDGRLVNRETGKPIPDDEPVFILRAQDVHALGAMRCYASLVAEIDQFHAVTERIKDFEAFAKANPSRMKEPDAITLKPF